MGVSLIPQFVFLTRPDTSTEEREKFDCLKLNIYYYDIFSDFDILSLGNKVIKLDFVILELLLTVIIRTEKSIFIRNLNF